MAGAGKKTFTAGEVLTASDVNTYLMEQSVMNFAGTAARSSAIPTPTEGMVSYLADSNAVQVYNGAAYVGVGGLSFITGASFTTVTSFSLPNDTFTSTYNNYKLIVQLTALTADADFSIRLRASGTDNSSSVYAYAMPGYTYGGSASNSFAETQTSFNLGEQDSGIVRYFAVMDVISPQAATLTYLTGSYNFLNKLATVSVVRTGNMQFTNSTQFDSLSFISSVASSMTGTYRVYGYANS